jgi:hypothetical protein
MVSCDMFSFLETNPPFQKKRVPGSTYMSRSAARTKGSHGPPLQLRRGPQATPKSQLSRRPSQKKNAALETASHFPPSASLGASADAQQNPSPWGFPPHSPRKPQGRRTGGGGRERNSSQPRMAASGDSPAVQGSQKRARPLAGGGGEAASRSAAFNDEMTASSGPPSSATVVDGVTVVDPDALDCVMCRLPLKPPIFQVRARSHGRLTRLSDAPGASPANLQ